MATTGAVIGNGLLLYIEGVAIACTTDASFDFSREILEVTCKDNDGAKQIRLGGTDGSFSVSGIWKFDAAYGVEDLVTAWLAGTLVTVRWATDSVGDFYLEADAYITNISGSSPVNDAVTFEATFSITGVITKGDNT
jgi:predicted secreted protein